MKDDTELLQWFGAHVEGITNIDTDFQDGLALLQFVERLTGVHYPKNPSPQTKEQRHKNVTIAFMAIFNMFEGIDPVATVDEIVEGDPIKTRQLLEAISSDEWEIAAHSDSEGELTPRTKEFNIEECDLSSYPLENIILCQSLIRRYLDNKKSIKRAKKRKYRDNVAKEILETEEHYVNCLKTLVDVYYEQLKWKADMAEQTRKEPILTLEEISLVFSNILTIYEFNQKLLHSLQERVHRWSYTQKLGDVFLEMAPFLRIYTQYCNNYEYSIAAVEKLKKQKPLFASYLTESNLHLQQSQNYFESLLITPIQRGPRYALLLKELLSRTDEGHPDYQNLKQSITAVEEQINSVNKRIRESQASNEVVAIQEKLVGDDIPNLVSPSRFYVSECTFKLCNLDSKGLSKEFESVHLFVFNDCILYTKKQSTRAYKFRNIIPLGKETRLKDIPDRGVVQNAFTLISPEKTVTLACHSEDHKKEWMDLFRKLQDELLSKIKQTEDGPAMKEGSLNVHATIMGTKKLYDKSGKSFTDKCYSIRVTPAGGDPAYTVYRRYREFDAIWHTLKKKFPDQELMQLPKKHIIGNMKKDIVESRQIMLETFLDDVLTKPVICESSELFIFLQPSDNYAELAGGKPMRAPKEKGSRTQSTKRRLTTLRKSSKDFLSSSAPQTDPLPRNRSSTVSLEPGSFRKTDAIEAAKLLETGSKPLFVKKGTNSTQNLEKLQKNKSVSTSNLNALVSPRSKSNENPLKGFIPVLPPVPIGHTLRSTTGSRSPRASNEANDPRMKFAPRKLSTSTASPASSKHTSPRGDKGTKKTTQKSRTEESTTDNKPTIPPKPNLDEFAPPPIAPKPSLDEFVPASNSSTSNVANSSSVQKKGSRVRTVQIEKKKLSRKYSSKLPSAPSPPPS